MPDQMNTFGKLTRVSAELAQEQAHLLRAGSRSSLGEVGNAVERSGVQVLELLLLGQCCRLACRLLLRCLLLG